MKLPQRTQSTPTSSVTCPQTTTSSPSPPNPTPLPSSTSRLLNTSAAVATKTATPDLTSAALTGPLVRASSLLSQTALLASYRLYQLAGNQMNSMT